MKHGASERLLDPWHPSAENCGNMGLTNPLATLIAFGRSMKEARAGDVLRRQCWLWALIGAVVLGVTLPTILVCWTGGREGPWAFDFGPGAPPAPPANADIDWSRLIMDWIGTQVVATIGCGPGAIVLGLWLFAGGKMRATHDTATLHSTVKYGIITGCVLAFLNLPGYLANVLIREGALYKVPLLFAVAGASSGAWIAWQAWRAVHPEERNFWPRFSLGTLMVFVIGWGALMAVFAPK
jgi:hypothetical protein